MESDDFMAGQPTPPNIPPSDIGLNKALLRETNA